MKAGSDTALDQAMRPEHNAPREILERLKADHRRLLADVEGLSSLLPLLRTTSLPSFIARLWDLVSAVEKHEEFEESFLLVPLTVGVAEEETLRWVDRVRREHGQIFDQLTDLQDRLSSCRCLGEEKWNDMKREEIRLQAERVLRDVRGHIRGENAQLKFLPHGKLAETTTLPRSPGP